MSKRRYTPPVIDPANTWLVSDTHFGHENIVGFCHRPERHEEVMMEEWARAVPDDATVIHLGDLSYRANGMFKNVISKHLTGDRKLLIRGNHDKQRFSFYRDSDFKITRPMELYFRQDTYPKPSLTQVTIARAEWVISLNHYAWNTERDGPQPDNHIRIHGHIHNNGYSRAEFVPFLRNHINISVEQTKYRPVNLLALLEGYLLGVVPADDDERAEAAERKAERMGTQSAPRRDQTAYRGAESLELESNQ